MFPASLTIFSIVILCHGCQPVNYVPKGADVVTWVNDINDYPATALQSLSQALKTHPQAVTFRVTGRIEGGMFPRRDLFTALYNRQTRTLRYYCYYAMRQTPEPMCSDGKI